MGNFRVAYSDLSRTSFNGTGGDGADPLADLVRNSTGNLYGRTASGGASGLGTVFKLRNGVQDRYER